MTRLALETGMPSDAGVSDVVKRPARADRERIGTRSCDQRELEDGGIEELRRLRDSLDLDRESFDLAIALNDPAGAREAACSLRQSWGAIEDLLR